MSSRFLSALVFIVVTALVLPAVATAQIGQRFPSERKIVPDPVTGVPLTFLTTTPNGDSKIYPTHPQWTSDGQWLVFRSNRVRGQAMAVNEATGDIVQITEHGYAGALSVGVHSMRLFHIRPVDKTPPSEPAAADGRRGSRGPMEIVAIDLAKVFADSKAGKMKPVAEYEHVFGVIPENFGGGGELAIDATEEWAYFRLNREEAAKHLAADAVIEPTFGPRNMGAGPAGIAKMNLKTGETSVVVAVPFQVGHVQTNPWVPGEIVFCWETGGKAPQRTWTVNADGTGLRPVYPEAPYDWVTHEAVISRDEVALAILAHRRIKIPGTEHVENDGPGQGDAWGPSGTGEHPTGLAIVNLRTREMRIVSQVPMDNPGRSVWHVHGSPDGRWAVADDFQYRLWITDRRSGECMLLADLGHKSTAQDHIHPTFNADSTKIQIQTAMLSEDGRSMNICVVPVPQAWLARTYDEQTHPTRIAP